MPCAPIDAKTLSIEQAFGAARSHLPTSETLRKRAAEWNMQRMAQGISDFKGMVDASHFPTKRMHGYGDDHVQRRRSGGESSTKLVRHQFPRVALYEPYPKIKRIAVGTKSCHRLVGEPSPAAFSARAIRADRRHMGCRAALHAPRPERVGRPSRERDCILRRR